FEQLFHADYSPTDLLALNQWAINIGRRWTQNDLTLNDALMAMPSYSKFHLLFAVQACFSFGSAQSDKVPAPSATLGILADGQKVDAILTMAANCYNAAFENARSEIGSLGRVFSPPNWLKSKDSVLKIQAAANMYLGMVTNMPGGQELKSALVSSADKFMLRWSAD
ncbi:MAG TPA: AIPR protein, partial [Armatimonadota bacterium]|nr:AIPR protein [Armatimonadota bacterium]